MSSPGGQDTHQKDSRAALMAAIGRLVESGEQIGAAGNMSLRTDQGLLITPTGIPYRDLAETDLPEVAYDGTVIVGQGIPSSEWQLHAAIYQTRPDIHAVVHTHSPWATAVACARKDIPALHYHIARTGASVIRCAEYATFGSEALAVNAVAALADSQACLLANHGVIATGATPLRALELAREVENLAMQYLLSLTLGGPVLLDEEEVRRNIEKFSTYGVQGE